MNRDIDHPEALRLLCIATANLSSACCVGNPAPIHTDLCGLVHKPRPGDLVFEYTHGSHWRPGKFRMDSIGFLLLKRYEPIDGWDEEANGEPAPDYPYTYIEMLDGRLARWHNCAFYRILPATAYEMAHPEPTLYDPEEARKAWWEEAVVRHGLIEPGDLRVWWEAKGNL